MSNDKNIVVCGPGGRVSGDTVVPGDKSQSHRAIIFASLASGTSHISGFLAGEDSLNTLAAFRSMGVDIERNDETSLTIHGVGMHGLRAPEAPLYMGNAGTGMRLLAGTLAAQRFASTLTGDESLSRRPMDRIVNPLLKMGASISGDTENRPPLNIAPAKQIRGIDYQLPMASAQVKSCVLLAGLYADAEVTVTEPEVTRDHTERMLRTFGYPVTTTGRKVSLTGGGQLQASDLDIPADISSAAFLMVAGCIAADSDIVLRNIGVNPTRTGIIDILQLMGANLTLLNERQAGDEPVADIRVRSSQLRGIEVPEHLVPLAIDELPIVFVAAACAEGTTVVTGASELRVKESDRIAAMESGLLALGADAKATHDGMIVTGGPLTGGTIETHFDHRIAMSFCVASLRASAAVVINDAHHVETSFPGFFSLCRNLGLVIDDEAGA